MSLSRVNSASVLQPTPQYHFCPMINIRVWCHLLLFYNQHLSTTSVLWSTSEYGAIYFCSTTNTSVPLLSYDQHPSMVPSTSVLQPTTQYHFCPMINIRVWCHLLLFYNQILGTSSVLWSTSKYGAIYFCSTTNISVLLLFYDQYLTIMPSSSVLQSTAECSAVYFFSPINTKKHYADKLQSQQNLKGCPECPHPSWTRLKMKVKDAFNTTSYKQLL